MSERENGARQLSAERRVQSVKPSLSQSRRGHREKKVNIFPSNPEKARIPRDFQPARIIYFGRATIDTMIKTDIFRRQAMQVSLIADLSQSGQIQIKLLSAFSASLAQRA